MHQYKDNTLLEDDHNAHLNPFLMTIIRSIILNILHLNGTKSIQEQLINNRLLAKLIFQQPQIHGQN